MMDYKVIKSFIDKVTNKGYNSGSTYTSIDDERATFLINEGYLKGESPPPKHRADILKELNMTELRKIAKDKSIAGYTKLKEDALIQAIISTENGTGDGLG